MVQHWSPMSQLQRSPEPGVWFVFDKGKRIAIIRYVEIRDRRLLRAVTFHSDPTQRLLLGYFPDDGLRLAVECIWTEYIRDTGTPVSNRR